MSDEDQASWKNRRRMAWLSFAGLFLFLIGMMYRLMFGGDDPSNWTGLGATVLSIFGAIVVGYSGFATWEQVKKKDDT